MIVRGKKRGPKGPRIDDLPALRAMIPLVNKGMKLRAAAAQVVREGRAGVEQSEAATVDRLRRKFRADRPVLAGEASRQCIRILRSAAETAITDPETLLSRNWKAQIEPAYLRVLRAGRGAPDSLEAAFLEWEFDGERLDRVRQPEIMSKRKKI